MVHFWDRLTELKFPVDPLAADGDAQRATKRRENFLEALVRVASFRLQHARLSRAEASRKRFV